uniref:HSR domain-containing protein n=1 Tax=Catagonus wagneri TaxID=51154 RepID=A0A8C3W0U0_9CETA
MLKNFCIPRISPSSLFQDKEEFLHEIVLNHFKENKVEIANAITKLFPSLRASKTCLSLLKNFIM